MTIYYGSVPPILAEVANRLADPADAAHIVAQRRGRGSGRHAAVLILFAADHHGAEAPDQLRLVLVEKSAHLRYHAGQMAFPGGRMEPDDASAVAAALREADEEVGVPPDRVTVLGQLPAAHVRASGFDATSVVGWWREPTALTPVDTDEIAAVHIVPVRQFLDPATRWTAVHPSGYRGPAFMIDDLFVWGFTAGLLDGLFNLAGWTRNWDRSRTTAIPARFLHGRRADQD